jgi:hypothetical protein
VSAAGLRVPILGSASPGSARRSVADVACSRCLTSERSKVRVHDEDVEGRPVGIHDLDHHRYAERPGDGHRCPRRPVGHPPGKSQWHVKRTRDAGRGDGTPPVDVAAEKPRSHASRIPMKGRLVARLHGEDPPVRGRSPPWGSTRKPRSTGPHPGFSRHRVGRPKRLARLSCIDARVSHDLRRSPRRVNS